MKKHKIPVFNPLNKDVSVYWDLSGKNPLNFQLIAKEITMIDRKYAQHVKNTLADIVFDIKGSYQKDRDMQMKEIMNKISPKI